MPTPTIIEQPSSQTILVGDGVVFNVNSIPVLEDGITTDTTRAIVPQSFLIKCLL